MKPNKKPSLELRLRVLSAINYAPGDSVRKRIKHVAKRIFKDELTGCEYAFTWPPTSFYRMVRENNMLDLKTTEKLRLSFSMQYANELWQADTLYGPAIKQPNGTWRKTFLIAFIDDASRVITHAEFFYRDNTDNMIDAFRTALYKRGKPERLYFDHGANYSSKEILQACIRLNIMLSYDVNHSNLKSALTLTNCICRRSI